MRVLVERTARLVQGWLEWLDLHEDVGLHVVMAARAKRRAAASCSRGPLTEVVVACLDAGYDAGRRKLGGGDPRI